MEDLGHSLVSIAGVIGPDDLPDGTAEGPGYPTTCVAMPEAERTNAWRDCSMSQAKSLDAFIAGLEADRVDFRTDGVADSEVHGIAGLAYLKDQGQTLRASASPSGSTRT